MLERYFKPVFESLKFNEPLDHNIYMGLDYETREYLRGIIKTDAKSKPKPFVYKGANRLLTSEDE